MRKILLIGGVLAIGAAVVAYLIYNKPHQNMDKATADIQITASELLSAFESDESAANAKFLDKIVAVTGEVRETSTTEEGVTTIVLDTGSAMSGIVCELDTLTEHPKTDFQPGETITVKGVCTGMLMDVVLVRCVVE
jgi:hypothetical protein